MRILIADDHAVVLRGLRQILAEAFKRSVFGEATNSQEALDCVLKEPWDIVILDLTMPGMGGEETFHCLRRVRREIPIVLTSGYDESLALQGFPAGQRPGFLQKPYTGETLAGKVRAILKSRAAVA